MSCLQSNTAKTTLNGKQKEETKVPGGLGNSRRSPRRREHAVSEIHRAPLGQERGGWVAEETSPGCQVCTGAEEGTHTYLRCRRHYNQPGPAPLQQDMRDLSYPCTEPSANTQTDLAPHGSTLTWMVVVIDPDMAWLQVGHPNLPLQMQNTCLGLMAQLGKKSK